MFFNSFFLNTVCQLSLVISNLVILTRFTALMLIDSDLNLNCTDEIFQTSISSIFSFITQFFVASFSLEGEGIQG
ncbi:hypothetical protein HOB94_04505 [bacterium]|nr:hypothetical protein [bacterium]